MNDKPEIESTATPSAYAWLLGPMKARAKQLGYALALHGSLRRDLDLLAVPWVDDAAPAETLVEALREVVGGSILPDGTPGGRYDPEVGTFVAAVIEMPSHKPHGRLAWNIHLPGHKLIIDLSVMPRAASSPPPQPPVPNP